MFCCFFCYTYNLQAWAFQRQALGHHRTELLSVSYSLVLLLYSGFRSSMAVIQQEVKCSKWRYNALLFGFIMDEASCKKHKSTCLVFILPLLVTESFNKMYKIILLERNPCFSNFWQDRELQNPCLKLIFNGPTCYMLRTRVYFTLVNHQFVIILQLLA